jgi:hypothetical protein
MKLRRQGFFVSHGEPTGLQGATKRWRYGFIQSFPKYCHGASTIISRSIVPGEAGQDLLGHYRNGLLGYHFDLQGKVQVSR